MNNSSFSARYYLFKDETSSLLGVPSKEGWVYIENETFGFSKTMRAAENFAYLLASGNSIGNTKGEETIHKKDFVRASVIISIGKTPYYILQVSGGFVIGASYPDFLSSLQEKICLLQDPLLETYKKIGDGLEKEILEEDPEETIH